MIIHRLHNLEEWLAYTSRFKSIHNDQRSIESDIVNATRKNGLNTLTFPGYSYTAQTTVNFQAPVTPEGINWRESIVCPLTGLINRIRFGMHIFDIECQPHSDDQIYVMEQTTPLFDYLSSRFRNVIGSEYLGARNSPGEIIRGIRHEDITDLSFDDGSIDHIHSYEVMEHVPDFNAGLRECCRVLRRGGTMLITAPFIPNQTETVVRASLCPDGSVIHHCPPEYHGDPVNKSGVLCYYHFGWNLLDNIRECGFSDSYVCTSWAKPFGYLGVFSNQIIIARK